MTTMKQSTETTQQNNLSQPRIFTHLNGLALLIGSIVAYGIFNGDWLAFILLLFVPDISMLGYAMNSKVGAWIYNIGHSYMLAISMMLIGYAMGSDNIIAIGLILLAHIGLDQVIGYGYKYADAEFSDTHINRL